MKTAWLSLLACSLVGALAITACEIKEGSPDDGEGGADESGGKASSGGRSSGGMSTSGGKAATGGTGGSTGGTGGKGGASSTGGSATGGMDTSPMCNAPLGKSIPDSCELET